MKQIFLIAYSVFLIFFIQNCKNKSTDPNDDVTVKPYANITVKPIVEKTSTDYTQELFRLSFPKMELLKEVGEAYKNNYSEAIKNELINYMKKQVDSLGESGEIFSDCMEVTGCKDIYSISLPCYAEKAKYEGNDVWIIQLVWGMMPLDLGHYKCFAISTNNKDTLDFKRCK
jgi:hypothetical protein